MKVRSDEYCEVWHKQDTTFLLPKADVSATIIAPVAVSSPRNTVLTNLYNKILDDSLNEYAYFADIAGLEFSLSVKSNGFGVRSLLFFPKDKDYNICIFQLHVRGYQERLPLLLEKIVKRMLQLEVNPTRFTLIKEKVSNSIALNPLTRPFQVKRDYENFFMEQPWEHGLYEVDVILMHRRWKVTEKIAAIEGARFRVPLCR